MSLIYDIYAQVSMSLSLVHDIWYTQFVSKSWNVKQLAFADLAFKTFAANVEGLEKVAQDVPFWDLHTSGHVG